jgi:hypothetical protein
MARSSSGFKRKSLHGTISPHAVAGRTDNEPETGTVDTDVAALLGLLLGRLGVRYRCDVRVLGVIVIDELFSLLGGHAVAQRVSDRAHEAGVVASDLARDSR